MSIEIKLFSKDDLPRMTDIWNAVVEEGVAFPQTEPLTAAAADEFFSSQTCSAVARDMGGEVLGLYILHPNNIGRCGHISNASFAVAPEARGRGIGEMLVRDCLDRARFNGFKILQFNAVVKSNAAAHRLYEKIGFTAIGTVPGGFLNKSGEYEDIVLYYYSL